MGKVILFKNNKGGVGKSLITFWTAHAITSQILKDDNTGEKHKVLILTSDCQNNILGYAGIKNDFGLGLESYIENGSGELIRLREELMYIPLINTEIKKSFKPKFKKLINNFKKQYDYILIDGSPVLKLDKIFAEISDLVVIPTYLDFETTKGIFKLTSEIETEVACIVPNRVGRSRIEKEYFEKLKDGLEGTSTIVTNQILQTAKVTKLIEKGKTIWETKAANTNDIKQVFVQIVGAIL